MLENRLFLLLLFLHTVDCERFRAFGNNTRIRGRIRGVNPSTPREKTCGLHDSIFVKKVLDDNFYPVYEKYNLDIPQKCPFSLSRNIHRSVVENTLYTMSDWPKCGFCGKAFYDENFFLQHMNRKHNSTFSNHKDSICLADYCDVFRCEVHKIGAREQSNELVDCDAKKLKKIQMRCEKVMQGCLPPLMSEYVYDSVMTSICASLTCDKYHIPTAEPSAMEILIYVILTVMGAFLFLVVCCFVIDNLQYQNMEERTERRDKQSMPRHPVQVMKKLETTAPRNRRFNTASDHVFINVDSHPIDSTVINIS